ncbi:MAG: molecular chaperone DnaJ [Frankiales bacterium]|nr:molecular chaperone DnaJ [Frankiales bacterium]
MTDQTTSSGSTPLEPGVSLDKGVHPTGEAHVPAAPVAGRGEDLGSRPAATPVEEAPVGAGTVDTAGPAVGSGAAQVASGPVSSSPVAPVAPVAAPVEEAAPAPVDPAVVPAETDAAGTVPADAAPDAAARAGRARRLAVLAAVLVVTVALGVVTLLLFRQSRDAREVASYYKPSSAPMSAARTAGRLLFSYDYKQIDKDFAAGAALTTGTFSKEYAQTTSQVVRPVAVENKAVVEASSVAQGLVDADPGRATVIVFVNQVTTSTKVTGQKVDQSRVRMTLVQRGDRWLVTKVEAL